MSAGTRTGSADPHQGDDGEHDLRVTAAIVWPDKRRHADDDPSFLVAYLPLEFAASPRQPGSPSEGLPGEVWREAAYFRNGLGLAIPSGDQVEILRRAVRYLIAVEGVKAKAKQLNLTDEQRGQLREREATEQAAAESAFLKLYTEVWLPRAEDGGYRHREGRRRRPPASDHAERQEAGDDPRADHGT